MSMPFFGSPEQQASIRVSVLEYIQTHAQLDVRDEYAWAERFLLSYEHSAETYKSYRREIERFLQWCYLEQKCLLSQIDRIGFSTYLTYAFSPPDAVVGSKIVPRFLEKDGKLIPNPSWRAYTLRAPKHQSAQEKMRYQMKNSAKKALFAGLSTFYTYLQQEEYVQKNPVILLRQKGRFVTSTQSQHITRRLSHIQWQSVIESVKNMADENPKFERHLFILSAFYLLGLRISELADTEIHQPVMGDFAPDKNSLWWFNTIGKGNKAREIAVPDAMLEALKRYRLSRGLTPLPLRGEQTPIVYSMKQSNGLKVRQIRQLVQECFDMAVLTLQNKALHDAAADLQSATVHWLRHTAISADVQHRPADHVRLDAGHESITTTTRYIDIDRTERHASARQKQLINSDQ